MSAPIDLLTFLVGPTADGFVVEGTSKAGRFVLVERESATETPAEIADVIREIALDLLTPAAPPPEHR